MKILKMAKMLFERFVFCKLLTYVTSICNHKSVIRAYPRIAKIKYVVYEFFVKSHFKIGTMKIPKMLR